MRRPRFALRTITDGRVRIDGRFYRPRGPHNDPLAYDGRLDGKRYAFGLYYRGDERLPFVCLWGSEELYRAVGCDSFDDLWYHDPMWVDGKLLWQWWEAIDA